jgi:Ca-activated chloride channel family protein
LPTSGETNEAKIVERIRQRNSYRTRLVNLGVGYDVNSRLLDRLARANYGQSEFVRPDEDLEVHVSRLHNRISAPVMTEVKVEVDVEKAQAEDGPPVNRVYPRDVYDLFAGEQLVLVGRYKRPGNAKIVVQGKVGDEVSKFDFPAELTEKSKDESYAFVEKLWAMRRIGEIIDELDLKGKNDELIQELVALSTKHGILTPYTSFLADENPPPQLATGPAWGVERARQALRQLDVAEGRAGFAQRAEKKFLQEATIAPQSSGFAMPAPAADGGFGYGRGGGGMGGMGGMGAAAAPAGQGGPAVRYRDIESDREVAVESVQIVGNETLYKRGSQWFAASVKDVDLTRDADKVQTVERFSDDYFQLVAANTPAENTVLARQQAGEELIVRLRGQIYRIR